MRSIEEKRDEEAKYYVHNNLIFSLSAQDCFKAGWDACAKEYEKENADLKEEIKMWESWHQNLQEITSEATKQDLENLFNLESAGE